MAIIPTVPHSSSVFNLYVLDVDVVGRLFGSLEELYCIQIGKLQSNDFLTNEALLCLL